MNAGDTSIEKNALTNSCSGSARKPCIFFCLRDFSSVRNMLPPVAVETLGTFDGTIVFLVTDPGSTFLRGYLNRPNFRFERLEAKAMNLASRQGRLTEWLRQVRFLTYGNSTPGSMGTRKYHAHVFREEMLGASRTPFGRMYYGSVIPAAHLAGRSRLLRDLIVATEARITKFDAHAELFRKYRPDWLIVPTLGYAQDPPLMYEARRHGTRLLSIVRSWDNTTNKGYGAIRADRVFTWSQLMAEEVVRHHDIPAEKVEVTGVPHWDVYFNDVPIRDRAQFFQDHGLKPNRKLIYYAMSGPHSFRKNFELIRLMLERIRDGAIDQSAQLLIRIHPAYVLNTTRWGDAIEEMNREIPVLRQEFGDLFSISDQEVEQIGDLRLLTHRNQVLNKEIFRYADVLVNIYSTQMVEAAIFDLPTVTAGWHPLRNTDKPISVFEEYDHVRRVLATGAVTTTHTPEELIAAINLDLADRGRLRAERKALLDQEITDYRGTAGIRTAQRIIELARNGSNTDRKATQTQESSP
jgi:hypothetical protein